MNKSASSRDKSATVDINKVVRGSGQLRGLLEMLKVVSTAGRGAGQ